MSFFESLGAAAKIKLISGTVITFALSAIGKEYLAYEILFILVVIDTITGVFKGLKDKNISSRRFLRTGHKLLLYFLLILASHQLTRYAPFLVWLEHFIVIFLAITEMISIIENAHYLGIPVPPWVTQKLETYLKKPEE